jgi:hypothetical protein
MSGGVQQWSSVMKVVAEISMQFLRESRESFDMLPQALLSDVVYDFVLVHEPLRYTLGTTS